MASKLTSLLNVVTGYFSNSQLNQNFTKIADEFDKVVYRDGTTPNSMSADLDLNSNDLLNAGKVDTDNLYVAGTKTTSTSAVPTWQGAWSTATAYGVDQLVAESGNTYICVTAHTSGTFATDLAAGKWELVAQKGATGSGTGDMLAANNLSDVADVATARQNLGLEPGVDVLANIVEDTTPQLGGTLDTNSHSIWWSKGTTQVSASVITPPIDGNYFHISGTATITGFNAVHVGAQVLVYFESSLTLTNGANFVLEGGQNIVTSAGDMALFIQEDSTPKWILSKYIRANGKPTVHDQVQTASLTGIQSVSAVIPQDNTKPQITEGQEIFSIAFTPNSASSKILVTCNVFGAPSSNWGEMTLALFDGSTDALAATGAAVGGYSHTQTLVLNHSLPSWGTTSKTLSVRAGPTSGTMYINGSNGGAQLYGGVGESTFVIQEIV